MTPEMRSALEALRDVMKEHEAILIGYGGISFILNGSINLNDQELFTHISPITISERLEAGE